MATSPRASAPTGTSGRGWTIVRSLGSRAVATSLATGAPNEPLVVQSFRLEDGERTGDPVRDARALMNLRHTNVGRIKEVVEKDSDVTVVSLFNDGETLAALRKNGPIPLAIELRILVDVLTGLAAIHAAKDSKLKPLNIVHGEVAPANVVIGTDGVPKVVQLTGVHANPGVQGSDTLGYVAPEILLADDSFDQRVDVYSAGVMLWEALTGTTLFPETNAGAIVTRHLSGRIRKPTLPADAAWAEGLLEVAQKAIATDPGGRYASANELAAEIKRVAKTNVAPTMKVATLVKERGLEAINARRTALGLPALPGLGAAAKSTAIAIKPPAARAPTPEPPKVTPSPPAALAPVPTPANGAPTTKPVPSEDLFPIDSEDMKEESAVKPAIRFPPPEPIDPSVHDRVTSPSPIPSEKSEPQSADFSDLALDSEPPPAPPGPPPKKKTEEALFVPVIPPPAAIPKEAEVTPPPPAAFAPSSPAAFAPSSPSPGVTPFASPSPVAPAESPLGAPPSSAPVEGEPKNNKRVIVFAVLGVAVLIMLFGLRNCMKGKPETDAGKTAPTTAPTVAKTSEPTPTAEPTATAQPTATATAEPTATATAEPTATAPSTDPTVAAKPEPSGTAPAATNTGSGVWTKPTAAPTSTKPKKTYDPQGI